jgi:hypothetical protein
MCFTPSHVRFITYNKNPDNNNTQNTFEADRRDTPPPSPVMAKDIKCWLNIQTLEPTNNS